jgi:hypothetical protein
VLIRIDPHAHLYDCYPLREWIEAAMSNLQVGSGVCAAVVIVDRAGQDSFARLRSEVPKFGVWSEAPTTAEQRCQQAAERVVTGLVSYSGHSLRVIRGAQYVTRERIEVLGLGVARSVDDGAPCIETIQRIQSSGGLACIPWSPGKWLGKRGAVVKSMLRQFPQQRIALGDISMRTACGPPSTILTGAAKLGFAVLPGSDPLPRRADTQLVGSYGCELTIPAAINDPSWLQTMLNALLKSSDGGGVWGSPNTPLNAARRFIATCRRSYDCSK